MSHHPLWWGTWNWGPRQVNPVLPLFILPLAEIVSMSRNKPLMRWITGVTAVLGTSLAAMQALVSYPFYQEAFKSGLTPKKFMWTWKASPVFNHWRFIKLANLEVAWGYHGHILWGILALDLILVAFSAWTIWQILRRGTLPAPGRRLLPIGYLGLILTTALTLHFAYRSPAYGGDVGFPEAADLLRNEWQQSDALVIYMWGDPPLAYVPKIAMLNYCKGYCPKQISVIKEQFIDGQKSWEKRLEGYLSSANRAWVIEQKIRETDPDRPVEFALSQQMYFVKSSWTGKDVRVLLFDKGKGSVVISNQSSPIEYPSETLSAFSARKNSDGVYVDLKLQVKRPPAWMHKISLQLLDSDWQLKAQKDVAINFFVPPNLQEAPSALNLKVAEYFPESLPPGTYKLILVLYDPVTGKRFQNQYGKDYLILGKVSIP
jgi:hypothetical protein